MRFITNQEDAELALHFLHKAESMAQKSKCLQAKCGAVIEYKRDIIGQGFNHPANEANRRCHLKKSDYHPKVTDNTCCIHAEQEAITDALTYGHIKKLAHSRLYFARIDNVNADIQYSKGEPFCTLCSKMALRFKIPEWVLLQEDGIALYDSIEYDRLSAAYGKPRNLNR